MRPAHTTNVVETHIEAIKMTGETQNTKCAFCNKKATNGIRNIDGVVFCSEECAIFYGEDHYECVDSM